MKQTFIFVLLLISSVGACNTAFAKPTQQSTIPGPGLGGGAGDGT